MQKPPAVASRVVPDTRWRDTFIAVLAGAAMLALIVYALVYLSRQAEASGMVQGVIVGKAFVPGPETQISLGHDGLSSRRIAGEYSFQVRVPTEDNRVYKVIVDPAVYAARHVGDPLLFKR